MVVHQLLSGAGPFDAVSGQALAFRRLFREWGWGGEDVAAAMDPRAAGDFRLLEGWRPAPGDRLLMHYSAYAPRLRPLLDLPNPSLLLSHNITPAKYLWNYEPVVAVHCAVGRAQLPDFAVHADLAAGVSEYNTAELREAGATRTTTIPVLFDRAALGPAVPPDPRPGPPTVLFVGRLAPHKRHDAILRAFALYRRHREPDARLVLVGSPVGPGYRESLEALGEAVAPGVVTIESGLRPEELWERYRSAHAFLCLSEHEGFCIPLLEAFHFGVPVIARPAGGIPEVAGDAALLIDDDDPALVAELLVAAVRDGELREELGRRGLRRVEAFDARRTAEKLRAALDGLG